MDETFFVRNDIYRDFEHTVLPIFFNYIIPGSVLSCSTRERLLRELHMQVPNGTLCKARLGFRDVDLHVVRPFVVKWSRLTDVKQYPIAQYMHRDDACRGRVL